MKHLPSALVLLAVHCASPGTAGACSVRGVIAPAELVERSDAIYLARAKAFVPAGPHAGDDASPLPPTSIRFEVVDVLKGQARGSLTLPGRVSPDADFNARPVPYTRVRNEGASGSCFASSYRLEGRYLLLIRDGSPYWAPLAPTTEQVRGRRDPWVAWVRMTVEDQAARAGGP